ncbi:MAG: hypothetical protein GC159_01485 [Phycisphaera sp.]|nr:hypothetical protein [Phycisphaera sp.]
MMARMSEPNDQTAVSRPDGACEAAFVLDLPTQPTDHETAVPPDVALNTEWLLTNGLGGFAMGSVCRATTRRYHSLLTVATMPPVGRINMMPTVDDAVEFNGETYRLSCHEFEAPGGSVFHPRGWRWLRRFTRDAMHGSCTWTYEIGPIRVIRTLRLVWGHDVAVMTYRVEPAVAPGPDVPMPDKVDVTISPLVALRDFHQQPKAADGYPFHVQHRDATVTVRAMDTQGPTLHMYVEPGRFVGSMDWWYGFVRRRESERGQDHREDLFCPGWFRHTFKDIVGQPAELRLILGAEAIDLDVVDTNDGRAEHLQKQIDHIMGATGSLPASDAKTAKGRTGGQAASGTLSLDATTLATLVCAADDFVVERQVDGEPMATVLAGYPWFADWGRDTMISLPGLMLCTGRFDEARRTLLTYATHMRNGLVPNRFDDYGGEPHYNTVDASLWFVHAALEYRRLNPAGDTDEAWGDVLAGACDEVIRAYTEGTDGDIRMDDDQLVSAGNPDTQLTWMDAARDGVVFTPRHGKAVEINALWHRALVGLGFGARAKQVKKSFGKLFWNDELGYLIDHVNEHGVDRSLRPNQCFAISLPGDLLTGDKAKKVVRTVRDRLLTPMGLRTLPVDDPNYHGRYAGSMFERDRAYHQGTVWAWLIGPFIEGWLRAHKFSDKSRTEARSYIAPLLEELPRHSVGQLHEIFEGDPPHNPQGCIAQAWSIAELLRVAVLAG